MKASAPDLFADSKSEVLYLEFISAALAWLQTKQFYKTVRLKYRPIGAENVEWRRFVTAVVHLHHRVRD